MLKVLSAALLALAVATPAVAVCGKKPPVNNWNLLAGDERVTGKYLAKLLPGHKVRYEDGATENYGADGSYFYRGGGRTHRSNGFKLYSDGIRCIDYEREPRYDLYVVNAGRLVLINWVGGRYPAKVLK